MSTRQVATLGTSRPTVRTTIAAGFAAFAAAATLALSTPQATAASAARPMDPDGGYSCLRDTGGGNGQCNEAMGLPPYQSADPDGGYSCLRDTGGGNGQCNEAMGLPRWR